MSDIHAQSNSDSGFTLVELLVALMVFSVLSLMIYQGLRQAGISWSRSLDQHEKLQVRYVVDQQVRWIIEQMRPIRSSSHPAHAGFIGSEQEMLFTGPLPRAISEGGLYRISIFFDRDRGVVSIYWGSDNGILNNPRDRADVRSIDIWKDVDEVRFSFSGKTSDNEISIWNSQQMPSSIYIEVDSADGFTASYTPMITQISNCKFDIVSRSCRD